MGNDDIDMGAKKLELIEWLSRVEDATVLAKIDELKRASISEIYDKTMPRNNEELQQKLMRSDTDIKSGKVLSQQQVEEHFKKRFAL